MFTQISPLIQHQPIEEKVEILAKLLIQRQPVEDEEEIQTKPMLQPQADEEEELQAQTSGGQPIRANASIENGINKKKEAARLGIGSICFLVQFSIPRIAGIE